MMECPSLPRWREWLDRPVHPTDRAEMAMHLEGCTTCQRLLDDLAGTDPACANLVCESTAPPVEPELARAMNQLKHLSPGEATAGPDYPAKIDEYDILGEVGRGGMGIVLKAFDTKLHRVVAIKLLAPHLAANAAARQRFLREARAAAAIAHEHVVTIHRVEDASDVTPYIVMQYVPGRSLQDRLDKDGRLELKEILRIGMQAAAGLAAAHAQGIVHRDVKPANILLENGIERVKLADFGLARAADDASLTASGVLAGSPMFMSPEQAQGDIIDQRSDLFALGAALYTMAAGHPPFRASTALAVLKRVCEENPRPLRQVNSDVPQWFENIVFKLMAKNPADRFATATEVADLLGEHLRHLQYPDAPMPRPVGLPGVSGKLAEVLSISVRPAVVAVLVPGALCVAAVFVILLSVAARSVLGLFIALPLFIFGFVRFAVAMYRYIEPRRVGNRNVPKAAGPPESANQKPGTLIWIAVASIITVFMLIFTVAVPQLLLLLIPVSYLASRAILAFARSRGEDVGALKWFIYPPLLVVDLFLLGLVLLVPSLVFGVISLPILDNVYHNANPHGPVFSHNVEPATGIWLVFVVATGTAGLWWMVLGMIFAKWPVVVHAVFRPFGDWFQSKHGKSLIYIGFGLLIIVFGIVFRFGFAAQPRF